MKGELRLRVPGIGSYSGPLDQAGLEARLDKAQPQDGLASEVDFVMTARYRLTTEPEWMASAHRRLVVSMSTGNGIVVTATGEEPWTERVEGRLGYLQRFVFARDPKKYGMDRSRLQIREVPTEVRPAQPVPVNQSDQRSWLQRNRDAIIVTLVVGFIAAVSAGVVLYYSHL